MRGRRGKLALGCLAVLCVSAVIAYAVGSGEVTETKVSVLGQRHLPELSLDVSREETKKQNSEQAGAGAAPSAPSTGAEDELVEQGVPPPEPTVPESSPSEGKKQESQPTPEPSDPQAHHEE